MPFGKIFLGVAWSLLAVPVFVFAQENLPNPEEENMEENMEDGERALPEENPYAKSGDIRYQMDAPELDAEIPEYDPNATPSPDPGFNIAKSIPAPSGNADCFSLYHFGSIDMPFQAEFDSVTPGEIMNFHGVVSNKNDYPVMAGEIYAKLYRVNDPIRLATKELIDQFTAVSDVNLPAKGEKPFEFTWDIPSVLPKGDYRIALSFITAKRFNLSGLSFTQDIIGNFFEFSVVSETVSGVSFPHEAVTMNGKPYTFNAFIPNVEKDEPIEIKASLVNGTPESQPVALLWKLYRWDAQNPDNLLQETSENIEVPAKGVVPVSFRIVDTNESVYLLIGEAQWKDAKAVLEVRIGRKGVDAPRVNFPAVTMFPFRQDEPVTLFSCLHNAGLNDISDGKLILSVKDDAGNTIRETEYTGKITGAMMAHKDEFTPNDSLDRFTLTAQIFGGDRLFDTVSIRYDCELIGACLPGAPEDTLESAENSSKREWIIVVIVVCGFLGAVSILFVIIWRKNRRWFPFAVFLVLFGIPIVAAMPREAEAKSTTVDGYRTNNNMYVGSNEAYSLIVFSQNSSQVHYSATVRDSQGRLLSDGDLVSVGTVLYFTPARGDITWFGSGYYSDSPYGRWKTGNPSSSDYEYVDNIAGFVAFLAYPSSMTVTQNGSAWLFCNSKNTVCTVKGIGTIRPVFTFANTYGYYWRDGIKMKSIVVSCSSGKDNECTNNLVDPLPTTFSQKTISFSFTAIPKRTLSVSKGGNGTGTVSSNPSGISCGADCTQSYQNGTNVTLTATANSNSTFTRWSGACTSAGSNSTCAVSMTANRSVGAIFTKKPTLIVCPPSFTISKNETKQLTARYWDSEPAGGATCSTSGTDVTTNVNTVWSSNSSAATVGNTNGTKGLVTGVSNGTADIKATYNGASATSGATVYACLGSFSVATEETTSDEEETGLAASLPWEYADLNTSRKCEYKCKAGTKRVGNECRVCACDPPVGTRCSDETYSDNCGYNTCQGTRDCHVKEVRP